MKLSNLGPYLRSKQVPWWKKGLGILGVAYIIWPYDAIPDVIPIVGWLDDLGVLALLLAFVRHELNSFDELRRQ